MTRRIGLPPAFKTSESPLLFRDPSLPVPDVFAPRGRWSNGPMHTFTDDYRQEFFWRRPQEGLLVALSAGTVTAPDFTVWTDDPAPWAQYQAWRSAVVAQLWQDNGVDVLPVVSFKSNAHQWAKRGSAWT